jgi:hypothetical protein
MNQEDILEEYTVYYKLVKQLKNAQEDDVWNSLIVFNGEEPSRGFLLTRLVKSQVASATASPASSHVSPASHVSP